MIRSIILGAYNKEHSIGSVLQVRFIMLGPHNEDYSVDPYNKDCFIFASPYLAKNTNSQNPGPLTHPIQDCLGAV